MSARPGFISPASARKILSSPFAPARVKKNKFGAVKVQCQAAHDHASKAEARRCDQLHLLQRGKLIRELQQQPQFWFVIDGKQVKHEGGRRVGYRADFSYFEGDTHVVEDVKGDYRDDAWTLRKAIFRALFPHIELREVP